MRKGEKRKASDFTGVPGELVAGVDELNLQWGRVRKSPYDPLLDRLSEATDQAIFERKPIPGLVFGDKRCKAALISRAKIKGIRVVFAETEKGQLYVRIHGRLEVIENRQEEIRKSLAVGPMSAISICQRLRTGGDETIDAAITEILLSRLAKSGEVVKQEGGNWKLIPRKGAGA